MVRLRSVTRVAPAFNKLRNVGACHEMDCNVLMLVAAALAYLANSVRPNQGEAFRDHSRRTVEIAEPLDTLGGEPGFLLEFLDRRLLQRRILVLVADEARREFEAAAADRNPKLLDQNDPAVMLGEDDDGIRASRARNIFPAALLEGADIFSLPDGLGRGTVIFRHSSISLSGISLGLSRLLGKCSARTMPMR